LSHLADNLELLSKRQPELALQLGNIGTNRVKIFQSACGLPTASYARGPLSLPLHSRYDPMKEARQTLKKFDCAGSDYFVLLGFGLGYILDALLEGFGDEQTRYFIVESDPEILKAALEARDFRRLLSLPWIHFAWPLSGPELAGQWQRFFDPVQAQKNTFVTHLPSAALDPAFFRVAAEMIQSQIFQIFTDINTLVGKSQEFLDNFVQNVDKAAPAPGVVKFTGAFSGVPGIIVSAGPSLDKNIHELRGSEERALILSTDTALKPLLSAGIEPHFVLTGDPSYANYRHLQEASPGHSILVAEATSYPAVFGEFEDRIVTCTFENSSLRSLSDLLGNKGILRAWGSVATMALDFALLLGCDPVIFVGQDLAHTYDRLYCSGLWFDEEWAAGTDNPQDWQRKQDSLRSARRTVSVEDIFGKPVESTDKLTAYWNWIVKVLREHPKVRFINATEGGILRDGVSITSLKEALYCYCREELRLRSRVSAAFTGAKENTLLYPGHNFSALVGETTAIQTVLDLGLNLCKSGMRYSPEELRKRLEATKESIYYSPRIASLLDCFNQMGNVAFLRKRSALSRHSADSSLLPEIKSIYAEYFSSVGEALNKIRRALAIIGEKLDLKSDFRSDLEGRKQPRNRYSDKPGMTIS
jgi:hypothetical protein